MLTWTLEIWLDIRRCGAAVSGDHLIYGRWIIDPTIGRFCRAPQTTVLNWHCQHIAKHAALADDFSDTGILGPCTNSIDSACAALMVSSA